jgi:DNA-binding PadR family transcriptional regulator
LETGKSLPVAALRVLLAIGPEERHGYAIMGEVTRITEGAVRMGPGTLYSTLKRLLAEGLVEETTHERTETERDDQRRRYYRLTTAGRAAVTRDVSRLEVLMQRSGARDWAATGGDR